MTARAGIAQGSTSGVRDRLPPAFVLRASVGLRRFLVRAADRLLPAQLADLERAHSFVAVHVMATVARLGVADALSDEPTSIEVLAGRLHCDAEALRRLLRVAAILDVVAWDRDGRVRAARGTASLRSDSAFQVGAWCQYLASPAHVAAWADLARSVQTGGSAFVRVHGRTMFEEFEDDPSTSASFSAGLGGLTLVEAAFVVAAYAFPESGIICDVGGGQGVLLGEILRRRPQADGMLVERRQVLEHAETYLASVGVRDRVTLVEGDLLGQISADADLLVMKWILHDWDDERCVEMLARVRDTMSWSARLLVIEGEQRPDVPDPRFSVIDLQMLVVTDGGRERSVEELSMILRRAGLEPSGVFRTATGLLLLEARRAPARSTAV